MAIIYRASKGSALTNDELDDNFRTLVETKIDKTGGAFEGPITLSGDPTAEFQPATRRYVDNNFLSKNGGALSGPLSLNYSPTSDNHAATKGYVDEKFVQQTIDVGDPTAFAGIFLNRLGTLRMEGQLQLVDQSLTPPTENHHAVSYGFMQTQLTDIESIASLGSKYLSLGGGALTGPLILHAAPTSGSSAFQAATKGYVDQTALLKTGGTVTGPIVLPGAPTQSLQASTKGYVDDNFVNKTNPVFAENVTINATPSAGAHAVTRSYGDTRYAQFSNTQNIKVSATPTDPTDLTTKTYVDGKFVQKDNPIITTAPTDPSHAVRKQDLDGEVSALNSDISDINGDIVDLNNAVGTKLNHSGNNTYTGNLTVVGDVVNDTGYLRVKSLASLTGVTPTEVAGNSPVVTQKAENAMVMWNGTRWIRPKQKGWNVTSVGTLQTMGNQPPVGTEQFGIILLEFPDGAQQKYGSAHFIVPFDIADNAQSILRFAWTHNTVGGTGNVKWDFTYHIIQNGDLLGTPLTASVLSAANSNQAKRVVFNIVSLPNNITPGASILVKITRDCANVADTFAGPAYFMNIGLVYESDGAGIIQNSGLLGRDKY